jgi:sterol desaturase/sphingolipid hydroxylase (fatty acid hydroxylase superfamily)
MELSKILELIIEIIQMPFSYFVSINKRIFWLYLLSSFFLALYVYLRSKKRKPFSNYFFSKKRWIGKSALVDYSLIFFNSLIKVVVLSPLLGVALYLAEGMSAFLNNQFGSVDWNVSYTTIVVLYTFCIVIVNDFFSFVVHYLMHKIPFLWEFHKIHHSATTLTPFTQYRIHPIELIINNVRGLVIKGVITGVFLYLGSGKVSIMTFLGVNVLNFLFYFFGANLRHSHVRLKYFGFLENIFISPFQHQIHHSNKSEHYDTNLGSRLAIWDYLFGTLIKSKKVEDLTFGLGDEDKDYHSFTDNLLIPFRKVFKIIKK